MQKYLQEILKQALNKLDIEYDEIIVEIPQQKENGDYATNLALKLTKIVHDNPLNIANKIVQNINDEKIAKIEIKNPGFINFFVKKDYLFENINKVISLGEKYGSTNIGKNAKVNIEFVSANPTGILHLGNARGGAYGDSLARILKFCGYQVTKEYYVNDAGNQITNLALSIKSRYYALFDKNLAMPENGYFGEEIKDIAKKIKEKDNNIFIEHDIEYYKEQGINEFLTKIKKVLKDYRIDYDVFTSERAIYQKYPLENVINFLMEQSHAYKKDDAIWFKATDFYDNKDRVLVKSDGSYTYLVPDISYHMDKLNRGYDYLIDVLGTDHHGYVARLKSAIKAMNYDDTKLDVRLLQLVKLIKNGEEVKMSKRTGNAVSLQELIEEVGVDAARYFFSNRSLDTQLDFDLDLVKKKSNENPYYYVSYAYARICTILNDYHDKVTNIVKYNTIIEPEAINLLQKVYEFDNVVATAAIKRLPHLVTNYVYELASLFHYYYSKHKIIVTDEKKLHENLNILQAVKITIYNALNLIGVVPPEKM